MGFCINCGKEIKEGVKFCDNCGIAAEDVCKKHNNEQAANSSLETNDSIICHNCGEKIRSADSMCKYCGTPVNLEKAQSADNERKTDTIHVYKRHIMAISAAVIFIFVSAVVLYMTTTAGQINSAALAAKTGNYQKAYDIVINLDKSRSDVQLYQKYYSLMLLSEEMIDGTYILFEDKYTEASELYEEILDLEWMLTDKEKIKFNNISAAFNEYDIMAKKIDTVIGDLQTLSEVSDQIEIFKSGKTFAPKDVYVKAEKWRSKLEEASSIYKEICPDKSMPHYSEVDNEIRGIMDDMKNSRYYNSNTVYYKEYGNNYTNLYNENKIKEIEADLKTFVVERCSSKIENVL